MTFIIVMLLLTVIIVLFGLSAGPISNIRENRRVSKDTAAIRKREQIATKALRAIANGAGNPILEAQDALDSIERTYTKELN